MIKEIDVDIEEIRKISNNDFLYNILIEEYDRQIMKCNSLKTHSQKRFF